MISPARFTRPFLAALLVTLLVLVQAGLLAHETEHAVMGGGEHCASCWVADHQHSMASATLQLDLPVYYPSIAEPAKHVLFNQAARYYTSRAPPYPIFS